MANVTTTHTTTAGGLHGVYFVLTDDGTPADLTDQLLLDASALTGSPTKIALESIDLYMTSVMTALISFSDATDSLIFAGGAPSGAGNVYYHWESRGQDLVVSPTISGTTGDVQITTTGRGVTLENLTLGMLFRSTV